MPYCTWSFNGDSWYRLCFAFQGHVFRAVDDSQGESGDMSQSLVQGVWGHVGLWHVGGA